MTAVDIRPALLPASGGCVADLATIGGPLAGTRPEHSGAHRPAVVAGLDVVAGARLDHLALAERYAAQPEQWPVAPRFNPRERWYHRLASEPDHEVWLLTWLPGQGTEIHDHGGSAGAFHVYAGTLTEDTVTAGADLQGARDPGRRQHDPEETDSLGAPARIVARELGEGTSYRFGTRHIHRIVNRSARPAISIHVYGPALTTMTRYRITEGVLDVVAVEKAGVQW